MFGIVFDMDGVIYRGDLPVEGAEETIEFIKKEGIPFLFLTNNSTKTPASYRKTLLSMGIDVSEDRIVTSGVATRVYMKEHMEPGKIFVVGGRGLHEEMEKFGWGIVSIDDARRGCWKDAKYVVVGLDPCLTYEKLKYAALAIENGAEFIATNPDTTYPAEDGFYPGAGAIAAALTAATGEEPLVIGKPNEPAYEVAVERLQGIDEVWMVGDRLDTDIAFAKRFRMKAIMVLTGVSTLEDLEKSKLRPDIVLPSVRELKGYIEAGWRKQNDTQRTP
ncbi:HAD-IIA family hydrolase [Thermococcus sp.]|uniref:HAD-IIA family hydrolase n=1 Tax=Thermococcus sp. TaxID=35749 RepID=UPI0026128A98|nr:HAD-IIA family hydrolase [Thermococcus sp.]